MAETASPYLLEAVKGWLEELGICSMTTDTLDNLVHLSTKLSSLGFVAGRSQPHIFDLVLLVKELEGPAGAGLDWSEWVKFMAGVKHVSHSSLVMPQVEIDTYSTSTSLVFPLLERKPGSNQAISTDIFGSNVPPFPPIHTYKCTLLPVTRSLQPSKIAIQTSIEKLKLEKNLRRLLQFSQSGPTSINYDHEHCR